VFAGIGELGCASTGAQRINDSTSVDKVDLIVVTFNLMLGFIGYKMEFAIQIS